MSHPTSSFSEIFYIDATNEQTLDADLKNVAPAGVGESAEDSLHWLAGKQEECCLIMLMMSGWIFRNSSLAVPLATS